MLRRRKPRKNAFEEPADNMKNSEINSENRNKTDIGSQFDSFQPYVDAVSEEDFENGENIPDEDLTYEQFLVLNPKVGSLKIQATTARGALPEKDAQITITKNFADGEKLFYKVKTNADGIYDSLMLPAPPRELSEKPGNVKPYATYDIVAKNRFGNTTLSTTIDIYEDVKTIIPLDFSYIKE